MEIEQLLVRRIKVIAYNEVNNLFDEYGNATPCFYFEPATESDYQSYINKQP